MLRGIRFLALACLLSACTAELGSEPDAGGAELATPQSIVSAHLGPHLGMTMTPAVRTCREQCWARIPFNACAQQRDACLATASTTTDQHQCRQMSLACGELRRDCMQGCWLGKGPATNWHAEEEAKRVTSLDKVLTKQMTPEIRTCRSQCWAKTPRNACAKQRDACLATASGDDAKHQSRVGSRGARRERTAGMRGCWASGTSSGPASERDNTDE